MVDDTKHQDMVPLRLTEREFLDLSRLAMATDRKPAEMARFIVRRFLYGNVLPRSPECKPGEECL